MVFFFSRGSGIYWNWIPIFDKKQSDTFNLHLEQEYNINLPTIETSQLRMRYLTCNIATYIYLCLKYFITFTFASQYEKNIGATTFTISN